MSEFKITPLGGLGQIGSNMVLVEGKSSKIIIDAGILFPYERFFDLNYLIPDYNHIPKPDALIITHGHEDHIGAVKHLIKKFPDLPIHAPPFAAKLIQRKNPNIKIKTYDNREELKFNDFNIYPIHVNHSIPHTYGLFIGDHGYENSFFYISDFKIDESGYYEEAFDFDRLKNLSRPYKRKVLFADSTNILSKTLNTPPEFSLVESFEKIFKDQSHRRIFVTTFASNIHRLRSICSAANKYQRPIVLYGRSVESYAAVAKELNILPELDKFLDKSDDLAVENTENAVIIVPGCQADFKSTLKRIANNQDSTFNPSHGDLFLFSSKAIPGNEKYITNTINQLYQLGAKVITDTDFHIHVSGHAGRNDIQRVIDEFQPTDFIPIHGEVHFLHKSKDYFSEKNQNLNCQMFLNHQSLIIGKQLKVINHEEHDHFPPLIYHGKDLILEKEKISERRKLSNNGLIICNIGGQKKFELISMGLPTSFDQYRSKIEFQIKKSFAKHKDQEKLRIEIRRMANDLLGYKPITFVNLL